MPIGTHLIKIKGTFDENWTEEKIRAFVKRKIQKDIDNAWHPDLELFGIEKPNIVKVWVYVQEAAIGLANKEIVGEWIINHITEKGISVIEFEIEKVPYEKGFVIELNQVSLDSL